MAWRWKAKPPTIVNRVPNYGIPPNLSPAFDEEIENWIQEGWLQPAFRGYHEGLVPLIPVEQPSKGNVRPVLDFREVNKHVICHTADADVCQETIRRWRQFHGKVSMLDLKKAYLQILVEPE